MIRRLAVAATWVLLLHLNLIATDLVCTRHHEIFDGAVPAMMHDQATANGPQSGETGGNQRPCKTPSRADCCQAMASCAVSLRLAPSVPGVSPSVVRATVGGCPMDAPISFAVAPEPPPPKA